MLSHALQARQAAARLTGNFIDLTAADGNKVIDGPAVEGWVPVLLEMVHWACLLASQELHRKRHVLLRLEHFCTNCEIVVAEIMSQPLVQCCSVVG